MAEKLKSSIEKAKSSKLSSSNPKGAGDVADHAESRDEGSVAGVADSALPVVESARIENDGGGADDPPTGLSEKLVRERNEARDQTAALLEAISLLSRLAAIDPSSACQRRRLGSRDGAWGNSGGENQAAKQCLNSEGNREEDKSTVSVSETVVLEESKASFVEDNISRAENDERAEINDDHIETMGSSKGKGVSPGRYYVGLDHLHADDLVSADGNIRDPLVIQGKIDALASRWALEQTAVPALLASIHRFQSNLVTIQAESDSATAEMRALHRSLADSRFREQRLERAVKKLYKQNKALKERLAKKKRDRKSLVKNVKEAVSGMKMLKKKEEEVELEERQVASRLRVHESMLRMGSMSSRSRDGDLVAEATVAAATARNSVDSLAAPLTDMEHQGTDDRQANKNDHNFDSGSIGHGSTVSSILDADALSITSISESSASTTSVDGSGVATVRLEPSLSFPPPARLEGEDGEDIDDHILVRDDALNWVSVRSKMGLGDTGSSSGGSIRPRSLLFSSTSSTGQSVVTGARERAASADDILSWSNVRASFGVGTSTKPSVDSRGDISAEKDKSSMSTSTMGQRLMAQLRSPSTHFSAPQKASHVYQLTFPAEKKIGLQFHKVHIEVGSSTGQSKNEDKEEIISFNHGQESEGASNVSPFREAAADLSADLKAIGVTIDNILLGHTGSSKDSVDETHQHSEPFSLESGGGAPGEAVADDDGILPDVAFVVCGYHGFNDTQNDRPAIGARLIAVDGESLERGHWTFKRLRAVIEARANSSSPGGTSTFTMSFRNETLTSAQQEALKSAISKSEEQHRPVGLVSAVDTSKKTSTDSLEDEGKSGNKKERKPLLPPSPKSEKLPILLEEKKETSFLRKLSLKRKDSNDVADAQRQGSGKSDAQREVNNTKTFSLPPSDAMTARRSSSEAKEDSAFAVSGKDDTISSTEEFRSTMKAMKTKFKSLF